MNSEKHEPMLTDFSAKIIEKVNKPTQDVPDPASDAPKVKSYRRRSSEDRRPVRKSVGEAATAPSMNGGNEAKRPKQLLYKEAAV